MCVVVVWFLCSIFDVLCYRFVYVFFKSVFVLVFRSNFLLSFVCCVWMWFVHRFVSFNEVGSQMSSFLVVVLCFGFIGLFIFRV